MSDFPAVPLILERKSPGHVHVVLGGLQGHINFLAEAIAGEAPVRFVSLESLHDAPVIEALQGTEPTIFVLARPQGLSLASDIRAKVGVWVAQPLKRRTAGLRVLVRYGVALAGVKPLEAERVDFLGDATLDALGDDALPSSVIWEAAYRSLDPTSGAAPATWIHPWEDPWAWTRGDFPLPMRLQVLYKDLVGYVFALDNDWKCAQGLGITPARFAWLKTLRLNTRKVDAAIRVISPWRTQPDPAKAARIALQVGWIFER